MGINITHTMDLFQFENKENLRNTAKQILNKSGASNETQQKIVDKTIFDSNTQIKELYSNPQLAVIKASSQISMNNTLKETLKYLKSHANKKITKEPVLGELWDKLNNAESDSYKGELLDFQIDNTAVNIFAA